MNSSSGQDVENLTASFDYLHAPSSEPCLSCKKDRHTNYCPFKISKSYEPQNPNYSAAGGRTVKREPRVMNEEVVHCRWCQKDHPTYAFCCPYTPCTICFKTGHEPFVCPFLRKIPKDAEFDRAKYEILCQCGNLFNVDLWLCTRCPSGGHALLKRKFCDICWVFGQHSYYECPKDKVRAAVDKSLRDNLLSRPPRFLFVGEEEEEEASTSQVRDSSTMVAM